VDFETVLAAVTLVVTVTIWVFDRYYVRRRRLSYRVHWDSRVLASPSDRSIKIDLEILHRGKAVPDASFVMLRVQNVGGLDIDLSDIRRPISFRFPGRTIRYFEVDTHELDTLDADHLSAWQKDRLALTSATAHDGASTLPLPTGPASGGAPTASAPVTDASLGERLDLPAFSIQRKRSLKLLVLLSGSGTGMVAGADLSGGTIRPERRRSSRTRLGLGLGALSLLLAGLLVGLILTAESEEPDGGSAGALPSISCPAAGAVSITGSTTMYPVISTVAEQYRQACPDALIKVGQSTSEEGLEFLQQGRAEDTRRNIKENARIGLAMVDQSAHAPSTAQTAGLESWSVAVTPFVVVVNKSADVSHLTADQLRRLYSGRMARWDSGDLDGADQPVVLISRPEGSGTRRTFEQRVLESSESAPISSSDCLSPNLDSTAAVLHCTVKTQRTLLEQVAGIDGAIGYASLAEAKKHSDTMQIITIDGAYPQAQEIADNRYPFWAVEKLFRIGPQQPASVRDYFVNYLLNSPQAQSVLQQNEFYACNDPIFLDNAVGDECTQATKDR